ncbi:MAG: leucine-rich repeat protein, partial [Anaeroplasmataceae bacterium]
AAFSGCSSLESITIPFVGAKAGVTSSDIYQYPLGYIFGENSYTGGEVTTQYYYGRSTSSRTYSKYYIPSTLKSVTVLGGNILYGSFVNCSNIKEIVLPTDLTSIGVLAFAECYSLESIAMPSSLESVGLSAFYGCSSLIYNEDDNAYYLGNETNPYMVLVKAKSTDITSYEINENTRILYDDAFYGCNSLTTVYYSGTIEDWCNISFSNEFSNPMYYADNFYMLDETLNTYKVVKKIEIPNTITSIGDYQFYGFNEVSSITIPSSVTSIGAYAFVRHSSLVIRIYYNGTIEEWCKIEFSNSYSNPMSTFNAYDFYILDETVNTYKVVTKIEIPNTITSIGDYQFYGFKNVTSITIPNSVTSIGSFAFEGCTSLTYNEYDNAYYLGNETNPYMVLVKAKSTAITSCEINENTNIICDSAFYNCSKLTSITISSSVTSIGSYAFSGCSSLESITIPAGVTSIGSYTFYGCSSLTKLIFSEESQLTSIGYAAFSECSSLESITIPFVGSKVGVTSSDTYQYPLGYIFGEDSYTGGVATIQYYYGSSTSSTTYNTYYIPKTLKSVTVLGGYIPYGAFYNCTNIEEIVLGEGITSIGDYAFSGCSSLTSIDIPSVTSIGERAFSWCSSLTSIDIPSVTSIGERAFSWCSSLTSLEIPSSVTSIGDSAFYGCSKLTNIEIPNSVTSIGGSAFSGCSSLESITIPFVGAKAGVTSSDTYQYLFGYIFGTSSYTGGVATKQYRSNYSYAYIIYYIPKTLKSVTVLGGNILYGAFYNCSNIEEIVIGEEVTSIGKYAFYNCSNLTSVIIPSSVTIIDNCAFYGCSSLTSVTFAEGSQLTSIGSSAFYNCTNLTTVYHTGTSSDWSNISIGDNNSPLTNATIYYYSESEPTETGNYWHYVDGVVTIW